MKKTIALFLIMLYLITICGCNRNENKVLVEKLNSTFNQTEKAIIELDEKKPTYTIVATKTDEDDSKKDIAESYYILENQKDYLLTCVTGAIDEIETLCKIIELEKTDISKRKELLIEDLCDKITTNSEKCIEINKKADEYLPNEQYLLALNALEIRNTYIYNLYNTINNIYNIMYNITDLEHDFDVKKTAKNIDTFGNNKTQNDEEVVVENPNANGNMMGYNNYYGYAGRGYSNPYYYGGYGGYGMYGGMMPMSPFYRNPYMPNIDTFGVYKNIDTYKPIEVKRVNDEE